MNKLIKNIKKFLPKAVIKKLPKEIVVKKVLERESREINRRYRHKNKSTNVLSFSYGKNYGEILVCPAIIRKEAKKQGNAYNQHMTWMILHGMLHLGGVHHESSGVIAKKSEKLEKMIMDKISLRM